MRGFFRFVTELDPLIGPVTGLDGLQSSSHELKKLVDWLSKPNSKHIKMLFRCLD